MNTADLRAALNGPQYEAATTQEGPLLVLAGAGSGKTRVLTYRIAYLVGNCAVPPWNILAITFTNKAAREMRERTERLLGADVSGMWLYTFHAACGRILRSYADRIGYTRNFTIYDDGETMSLLKEVQRRLNIDEKRIPVRAIRSVIARCKDRMQTPSAYTAQISPSNYDDRMYAQAYAMYQDMLKQNDAMDFDDMILQTLHLFQTNPDVLEFYQNKFRYILVDEYQDTNRAQYLFVSMLAQRHHNLCVVGDDDQSIYSFRGADITNILNFEQEYPGAKVVKLEQNYRSTQNILQVANTIIRNNRSRKGKNLWTEAGDGEKVLHYTATDQADEARYIAREIKRLVDADNLRYADFAVLYRANALSNSLENALMQSDIPYRVYGGLKFFERKEIKDLIAYLRVFNNPMDELSLRRAIQVPRRGIGETSLDCASEIARAEGRPLFDVVLHAEEYPRLSRSAGKMRRFASSFLELMMRKDDMGITEFVNQVLEESGLIEEYRKETGPEAEARIENLREFLSVTENYEKEQKQLGNDMPLFSEFLESIALSTDAETDDASQAYDSSVTLMTVHSAKGLEFPVVFVIGMEEGIFPSSRSMETPGGMDEECRLCYVAVTRAKTRLYLLNTARRLLYGRTTVSTPSCFLSEIPEEYLQEAGDRSARSRLDGWGAYGGDGYYGGSYGGSYGRAYGSGGSYGRAQRSWNFEDAQATPAPASATPASAPATATPAPAKAPAPAAAVQETYLTDCAVGERVRHKKFGDGTVTKILGEGKTKTLEIVFDRSGMKRILLQYAKLTPIP